MKASELIKRLQELIETDGDLNVAYYDAEDYCFCAVMSIDVEINTTHDDELFNPSSEGYYSVEQFGDKFIGIR